MRVYNLRAHHGMCLYFFRGKGYSGEFVKNMSAMKAILEGNTEICLMDSADDICAACPNRLTEICGEKACAVAWGRRDMPEMQAEMYLILTKNDDKS